jgi:hypothetical protein
MMRKTLCHVIACFVLAMPLCAQETLPSNQDSLELSESNFQFTFLFPPLSTNGVHNSKTVNKVSLNLLVGYAGAVDGVELGGLVNIDNYFAKGFQGAGFGNVVGGSVDGVQLAGFFNVNGGNTQKFQGAGFVNVSWGSMDGAQLAGFVNVTGTSTQGAQLAGFVNVTGQETQGAQLAGFVNVAGSYTRGAQLAGFVNVAGSYTRGAQLAGFTSVAAAGTVNAQISGLGNFATKVDGAQIAGFMNIAGNVKGAQIAAFINICDSIDGVPIGFINVVKQNGYRKFEFSISETQYFNFAYRMGVRHFHNIYSIGKPAGPGNRWLFGFGMGGETDVNEKLSLNIEALVHQEIWIGEGGSGGLLHIDRLNLLNQFRVLFAFQPNEKVSLFIGPTFNVTVAETNPDLGYLPWYEIGPNWAFYNKTMDNTAMTNIKMWFGVTGGVRL